MEITLLLCSTNCASVPLDCGLSYKQPERKIGFSGSSLSWPPQRPVSHNRTSKEERQAGEIGPPRPCQHEEQGTMRPKTERVCSRRCAGVEIRVPFSPRGLFWLFQRLGPRHTSGFLDSFIATALRDSPQFRLYRFPT